MEQPAFGLCRLTFWQARINLGIQDGEMNLPNKITVFRIALTPFFLGLFLMASEWDPYPLILQVFLVLIFLLGEVSDILDGAIARRQGLVTDLGKLLDPFADVISRVGYFLSLLMVGILPVYLFAVVIFREFSMLFLRMAMMKNGQVQAAKSLGKIKAVFYFASSLGGFVVFFLGKNGIAPPQYLNIILHVIFALTATISLVSFGDYLWGFIKKEKARTAEEL